MQIGPLKADEDTKRYEPSTFPKEPKVQMLTELKLIEKKKFQVAAIKICENSKILAEITLTFFKIP